jgi:hypothetical protein
MTIMRRVCTILSILSAALCVSVVALWLTSYGRNPQLEWASSEHYAVRSANGWISIYRISSPSARSLPTTPGMLRVPVRTATRLLVVPHVAAAGLLLIGPAISIRMHRRRRREIFRATHGLCLHCGYDLRASAERCPECGVPIAPRIVAKLLEYAATLRKRRAFLRLLLICMAAHFGVFAFFGLLFGLYGEFWVFRVPIACVSLPLMGMIEIASRIEFLQGLARTKVAAAVVVVVMFSTNSLLYGLVIAAVMRWRQRRRQSGA